jgi:hypothetical protein
MASVWECSRNDIAANVALLLAAGGVWLFSSGWPDVVVDSLLALLSFALPSGYFGRPSAPLTPRTPRQASCQTH